jgi:hypothetical protein
VLQSVGGGAVKSGGGAGTVVGAATTGLRQCYRRRTGCCRPCQGCYLRRSLVLPAHERQCYLWSLVPLPAAKGGAPSGGPCGCHRLVVVLPLVGGGATTGIGAATSGGGWCYQRLTGLLLAANGSLLAGVEDAASLSAVVLPPESGDDMCVAGGAANQ